MVLEGLVADGCPPPGDRGVEARSVRSRRAGGDGAACATCDQAKPGLWRSRAPGGPEVFAGAYDRLRQLVAQLGSRLDDDRVHVTSVDTEAGPGLGLAVRHTFAPSPQIDESPGG